MSEPTGNRSLANAKAAQKNEFYTQWADIEREMNAYLEYDPNVFRGKTVLLPCDDPEWSNFTKYFALHFTALGLKKLISTSFAPDAKPSNIPAQLTLFESGSPQYDPELSQARGKLFTLTEQDLNDDGVVNIDDLQWEYLEGTGDFRSEEVTTLRDEVDFVITNPPFSLYREFFVWLLEGSARFAVIGSQNSITYKEVFPHIKENRVWLGVTGNGSDMVFAVPKGTEIKSADREKAERLGYPPDEQYDYTRLGNSCWFTNIDHGRRHEPMQLMTMADNLKFNTRLIKSLDGKTDYERYSNFDAIEIPFTNAIPADFDGVMGVPISWLDKYNPDQFEILGSSLELAPVMSSFAQPGTYPAGGRRFYLPNGDGTHRRAYERIVIRHRNPQKG